MLTDMTRVIVLRPAFPSRGSPCPISNQSLPSCDSYPEVPAPSVLALAHPISPTPHRILSAAPPDTHRRLKLNLRCVSGGATEGIRCGVGEIGCASASTDGAGTSGSESHEGSDWFEIGHGGSRLRNAGRRTVTLVMPVSICLSICGCELYSLCKRHSPGTGCINPPHAPLQRTPRTQPSPGQSGPLRSNPEHLRKDLVGLVQRRPNSEDPRAPRQANLASQPVQHRDLHLSRSKRPELHGRHAR